MNDLSRLKPRLREQKNPPAWGLIPISLSGVARRALAFVLIAAVLAGCGNTPGTATPAAAPTRQGTAGTPDLSRYEFPATIDPQLRYLYYLHGEAPAAVRALLETMQRSGQLSVGETLHLRQFRHTPIVTRGIAGMPANRRKRFARDQGRAQRTGKSAPRNRAVGGQRPMVSDGEG